MRSMIDLRNFVRAVERIVTSHNLGQPGRYARWLRQDDAGSRNLGANPYGCADAANILYAIGRFPDPDARPQWIAALQELQEPDSGLFREPTHDPVHTTAHVVAALELFDARPRFPLAALDTLRQKDRLVSFLQSLDWTWNPWGASHKGAGIYAALTLAGSVGLEWADWYFDWLWQEADPETGLWRRSAVTAGGDHMLFHHLAGSFHYLFNLEYARRPLRYPERMVDTCLRLYREGLFPPLGQTVGFAEVDWVYCLNRSVRQCGHRFGETRAALAEFAAAYLGYLLGLDPTADDGLNDLHQFFGAVCAVAELQQALPGLLRTERPLRLVLDRRPFI
jgi:hypothetical protein